MKKLIATLSVVILSACATTGSIFGPTPEAQIVAGDNSIHATTAVVSVLLKNDKITVGQATGYRAIIGAADGHLNTIRAKLATCRKLTGSTRADSSDPCKATVADDIALVIVTVGEVQRTLDAKQ